MKSKLACAIIVALTAFGLSSGSRGGDVADELSTIKINALDASASEVPVTDTGRFRVNRIGGDNSADLTVSYDVTGTATNGLDYKVLRGTVTIRAGRSSATIAVRPIDDSIPEPDETVIVTILADNNYIVGSPDSATVVIHSNE